MGVCVCGEDNERLGGCRQSRESLLRGGSDWVGRPRPPRGGVWMEDVKV